MELLVKTRTVLGKKVRSLRRNGLIPAEIFGHGQTNKHVEVLEKEFNKIFKSAGEHTIVDAVTEKGEKLPVLITDVSRDPLSQKVLSIDFHQIRMDEEIQTKIPIEFIGVAPAIKSGLVVIKVLEEIEIESLPGKIPAKFEVDLSNLETAGNSIHVSDLKAPEGVKILNSKNMVVVTVTEKAKEEVQAPAVAATPTEAPTETETPKTAEANPKTEGKSEKKA